MSLTRVDFPEPGHPGDRHQAAQRERDVHVVQVVLPRPDHADLALAVARPADVGHRDRAAARQVVPGHRLGVRLELRDRPGVHHPAAVLPRARADVDHPVRRPHRVLVVLDDDQRVPQVAQPGERVDQPAIVALVQPDRGLVEDVEHPDQAGPDLRREPDALGLAPGEGAGRAGEREVVEPDVEQEAEPRLDLLEDRPGDHLLAGPEDEPLQELRAVGHRERADLGDRGVAPRLVPQRHGEDLGLEPRAGADRAGHLAHVALVALAGAVGLRLVEPALQERHHALERRVVRALAAVAVAVAHVHLVVRAVEHGLLDRRRELAPRGVHPEPDGLRERRQQPHEVLGGLPHVPRRDRALAEGELVVGDQELRVDLHLRAQAGARRAGAVGRVEREGAGLEVVDRELVAVRAGHLLGEPALAVRVVLLEIDEVEHEDALGQPQRGLHRVGEALLGARLDREPVDDHRDVVLLLLLQRRRVGQRIHRAVDQDAGVALALELGEQVDVLALATADDRREHLEPAARLHLEHLVDDLLRGLLRDDLAAGRAVRRAGAGVEQPQVVVDLGDGPDGGARVAARGLLVDRHRRREALDEVDVGLVHLPEELARVRRERLDVASLALGEDGVERQARLARAGQSGEDDEAVARQVDVDAREVVLTGALDDEAVGHG